MTKTSKFILPLEKVDYTQINLVGGKAASLGVMLKADMPVPPGFVVTTNAYATGLSRALELEILSAFEKLGVQRVAVRSSAVAEDSSGASWAGQLDTVLNVKQDELIKAVEYCWKSIRSERAQSYAKENKVPKSKQSVAVVVQAMIDSDVSGVMFTVNPVNNNTSESMIEVIYGLGELLVQGSVTPESYTVHSDNGKTVDFSAHRQTKKLIYKNGKNTEVEITRSQDKIISKHRLKEILELGKQIEKHYGKPQDIEFAIAKNNLYIVQSRPITTIYDVREPIIALEGETISSKGVHFLGKPEKLFYWGPSRAKPLYMSDFMLAVEDFYMQIFKDPKFPNPPKTIALFHDQKMVWLSRLKSFERFTYDLFKVYKKQKRLDSDMENWNLAVKKLNQFKVEKVHDSEKFTKLILAVWKTTFYAEFALYGAADYITKKLQRFDEKSRQKIWGAYTLPDKQLFMQRIDSELAKTSDPQLMAKKYPWLVHGYGGVEGGVETYFLKRLKVVEENVEVIGGTPKVRNLVADQFNLTKSEIEALDLARNLAVFMDNRKAWMMQSRQSIKTLTELFHAKTKISTSTIENSSLELLNSDMRSNDGWLYSRGTVRDLDKNKSSELWNRYIEFKAANTVLTGAVVSNGGRHFVNGEVRVVSSPTEIVKDGRVLVVPSTSPSYVPLMRKARALVTDHGGMMSHAAIVARELGLPCIVGTKHATKTLKNGDKVVLDLVKGEINK